MEITRTCTKCNEEKPLNEFFNKNTIKGPIKKASSCKLCQRAYAINFCKTEKGKEQKKRAQDKYKKNNPDVDSKYHKLNEVKIKLNKIKYYNNNKDGLFLKYKERAKNNIKELSDTYIRQRIRLNAKKVFNIIINVKEIPKELIELKRIQLKTYRLCQQLQN